MSDLHWSTVSWATINLVLFESGVFTLEQVRDWVRNNSEDLSKRPEVLGVLQSEEVGEVVKGLKSVSNATIDWVTLEVVFAVLYGFRLISYARPPMEEGEGAHPRALTFQPPTLCGKPLGEGV